MDILFFNSHLFKYDDEDVYIKTKTVILISHRLENVVKSDCIYAMKDGKVAEFGTHTELMKNNGEYASLYNRQKQLEQYGKGGAIYE